MPILHESNFAKAGSAEAEAQAAQLADAPTPSTDLRPEPLSARRPERQRSGSGSDGSDEEVDAEGDDMRGDSELPSAALDEANRRVAAQLEAGLQGTAEELARTSLGAGGTGRPRD